MQFTPYDATSEVMTSEVERERVADPVREAVGRGETVPVPDDETACEAGASRRQSRTQSRTGILMRYKKL